MLKKFGPVCVFWRKNRKCSFWSPAVGIDWKCENNLSGGVDESIAPIRVQDFSNRFALDNKTVTKGTPLILWNEQSRQSSRLLPALDAPNQ
jgi:hypothetical protein